jgi:hypothetical protein
MFDLAHGNFLLYEVSGISPVPKDDVIRKNTAMFLQVCVDSWQQRKGDDRIEPARNRRTGIPDTKGIPDTQGFAPSPFE